MGVRYYSNTAVATTLAAPVNNSDTTIVVTSASGFPGSFPYTLILDFGASTQEVVEVSAAAGTTLTVTRGVDNTSAQSHGLGAATVHGISKRDVSEPNSHLNASTDVHGLSGGAAVVGSTQTQTLTNKTISGASNTLTSLPAANVTGNLSGVSSVTSSGAISGTTVTGSSTVTGQTVVPSGLTGATSSVRLAGGTASGAPGSGTFAVGDMVISRDGGLWICVTAGSPGTWQNVGDFRFLNLAGGTLTGGLTGTSGTFSGTVSANALTATNALTARNAALTGTSDIVQLSVKGNGTQTSNLAEWKKSDNTVVASITNAGAFACSSTATITGNLSVGGVGQMKGVILTADEDRISTTSLSDSALTLTVDANSNYAFKIYAPYQADATADLKYDITFPAGGAMRHTPFGPAVAQATDVTPPATHRVGVSVADGSGITMGGNSNSASASLLLIEGSLRVAGTSGSITLRFAQLASSATATSLKSGSYMQIWKIS